MLYFKMMLPDEPEAIRVHIANNSDMILEVNSDKERYFLEDEQGNPQDVFVTLTAKLYQGGDNANVIKGEHNEAVADPVTGALVAVKVGTPGEGVDVRELVEIGSSGIYSISFKALKYGTYNFEFIASDRGEKEENGVTLNNSEFAVTAKHSIYVSPSAQVKNWTAFDYMVLLEDELRELLGISNLDRKIKSAVTKSIDFFNLDRKGENIYNYFYGYGTNDFNGNKLVTTDKSGIYFFDELKTISNYLTDIVGNPSIPVDVKEDLIKNIKEAALLIAKTALDDALAGECQVSNCDELEKNAFEELGKGLRGYEDDLFVNSLSHYTNAWKFAQNIMGANLKKEASLVDTNIPDEYGIEQNYPNPFNPSTQIRFGLPENNNVKLQIYDIIGNLVTTLVDQPLEAGYHSFEWNASNLASGVYFYRISSGTFIKTMKLMLLK